MILSTETRRVQFNTGFKLHRHTVIRRKASPRPSGACRRMGVPETTAKSPKRSAILPRPNPKTVSDFGSDTSPTPRDATSSASASPGVAPLPATMANQNTNRHVLC
jgi:hypothetical protein